MPAANERYPGTSGSTQGEIKEINPAMIAIGKEARRVPSKIWLTTKSFIRQPLFR